jgi:lysophospholipase L1-like esterase
MALRTITQKGYVVTYDDVVTITPSTTVPGKYKISWKKPTMKKSGKTVSATYRYGVTLGSGVFTNNDQTESFSPEEYYKELSGTSLDFDSVKEIYKYRQSDSDGSTPYEFSGNVVRATLRIWTKQTGWLTFGNGLEPKSVSRWLAPEIPELSAMVTSATGWVDVAGDNLSFGNSIANILTSAVPAKILVKISKPYGMDRVIFQELSEILDVVQIEYKKTTSKTWTRVTSSNCQKLSEEGEVFELAITTTSMPVGEYEVRARARFSTLYTANLPSGTGISNPGYGSWVSVKFHAVKQFDNVLAIVDNSYLAYGAGGDSLNIAQEIAATRRSKYGDVTPNATTQVIVKDGGTSKDIGALVRALKVNKSKTTLVYIHFGSNDILYATSLSRITPTKTLVSNVSSAVSAYLAKDPGATVFVERLCPVFERSGRFIDIDEEYMPAYGSTISSRPAFSLYYPIGNLPEITNQATALTILGSYFSSYNRELEKVLGNNNIVPNRFRSGTRQRVGFGSKFSRYYRDGEPDLDLSNRDEDNPRRWSLIRGIENIISSNTRRGDMFGCTFTYTNRGGRLYQVAEKPSILSEL